MGSPWKTNSWWVSRLNFLEEVRGEFKLPERVTIHDITLRDGEQQAGVVFRRDEKIEIAKMLDEAGVDRIEAGMPAVSREDMEAVKAIAREGLRAKVFSFARCMKSDVDLALKCEVDGVVMEIPSSEHLIRYGYGWSLKKALKLPIEATRYARNHGLYVTFFTIDSTRADLNWWFKIIERVSTEGHMDSLAVVDTFGTCIPEAIRYFVGRVKERVKDKPVEAHMHNDFGLAVANSLAAIAAGAEVVHTTVNGIGERTGNTDLAHIVLALKVLYNVRVNVKLEKLYELSRLVERLSKVRMPPQYPVTGRRIFSVESGIIAGWWLEALKHDMPLLLFPYKWDLTGHRGVEIVLGKKSGRANLEYYLERLGIAVKEEAIERILSEVKKVATKLKRPLKLKELKDLIRAS